MLLHTPADDLGRVSFTLVWPDPGRQTWMKPTPGPFFAQCFFAVPQTYVDRHTAEGKRVQVLDDPYTSDAVYAEAQRLLAPALARERKRLGARA